MKISDFSMNDRFGRRSSSSRAHNICLIGANPSYKKQLIRHGRQDSLTEKIGQGKRFATAHK